MTTVPTPADTTSRPDCPVCGQAAAASAVRAEGTVRTGDYRCDAGHIWTTRWLEVA